jgi:hypothetical protein
VERPLLVELAGPVPDQERFPDTGPDQAHEEAEPDRSHIAGMRLAGLMVWCRVSSDSLDRISPDDSLEPLVVAQQLSVFTMGG